jgi:hypothetical protein
MNILALKHRCVTRLEKSFLDAFCIVSFFIEPTDVRLEADTLLCCCLSILAFCCFCCSFWSMRILAEAMMPMLLSG